MKDLIAGATVSSMAAEGLSLLIFFYSHLPQEFGVMVAGALMPVWIANGKIISDWKRCAFALGYEPGRP